jgi:hypothetical protein
MTVVLLIEWDNPLENERMNAYRKFTHESTFWADQLNDGILNRFNSWADTTNARHIVFLAEFESWEKLAQLMGSKRFQRGAKEFAYMVDNLKYRLMRPAIPSSMLD